MTFNEYSNIKYKKKPNAQQNHYLMRKMAKLSIPSFDGSTKCSERAWVQKLDTYFRFNHRPDANAIQFATLHIEVEAYEWWYHGLVTLGHANITSYQHFTQSLI